MEIVPLHTRFDLLHKCADLLNSEWPRSITARVFNLEKSCDQLPCSFIITEDTGNNTNVVGHSQLTPIRGYDKACLIQSVLVHKEKRGRGLGRILMQHCENYAKKLGINTVYLSTKDKQGFYERLGYKYCEPLNIYGNTHAHGHGHVHTHSAPAVPKNPEPQICPRCGTVSAASIPPPPPPPPMPPQLLRKASRKDWMSKTL